MPELKIPLAVVLLLLPLAACQTYSEIDILVPAVSLLDSGAFLGVPVRLNIRMMSPGTGEIFVNTRSLTEMDMQGSARVAAMVAAETTGEDISQTDFLVTLYANTTIIGGPSAGGAMTVAMIALLKGLQLRRDVMMTGMITPDGALGVVGGIPEKAYAAYLSGAKYFLVPEGQAVSYNSTTYEAVNVTEMARERWNLTVEEVSEVREAVTWFTGLEFEARPYPPNPVYTESYLAMMRDQSWRELEEARSTLESVRALLSGSGLNESLKSTLESDLDISENDLRDGYDAYTESRFYVASSKAFQSKISSRSVTYQIRFYTAAEGQRGPVVDQICLEVKDEIASADVILGQSTAQGIAGLECMAAAQSRVAEAKQRLEDSLYYYQLQLEDLALYNLAYSAERAYTARIWSNMTRFFPSRLIPDDEGLSGIAQDLLSDASILATYADLLYEEVFGLPIEWVVALIPEYSFIDPYESLEMVETGVNNEEWAMAAFEALESEVRSGLAIEFINVLVLAEDEEESGTMMKVMANKSKAKAHIAIEDSREIGVEPVLSVSRFEFSEDLYTSSDISALGEAVFGFRFARSAARLSPSLLDMYRPRLEVPSLNGSVLVLNATVKGEALDPNGDRLTLEVTIGALRLDYTLLPGPFSIVLPTRSVPDGAHSLVLNLTDGALFDCASFRVMIDNNPPTILLSNIRNGTGYARPVKPDLSVWDAADPHPKLDAKLDGLQFDMREVASQGRHVLQVRAQDQAGWGSELTVVFWIDTARPTIKLGYPSTNRTSMLPSVAVWWSSADNVTGVVGSSLSFDGGQWTPARETNRTALGDGWASRFESSLNASEGAHRLSIRALDAAGNQEMVTLQITLDGTPPDVGFSGVADGHWYNRSVAVQLWARDALDPSPAVVVALDGKAYVAGSLVGQGKHHLVVNATDWAGNARTTMADFVVDLGPPRIQTNVTDGAMFGREITVQCSGMDDLDPSPVIKVLLDGRPYSGGKVVQGNHTIDITARDAAGNAASTVATFVVDAVAPAINASVVNGEWYATAQVVDIWVQDDLDPNPSSTVMLDGYSVNRTQTAGEGAHEVVVTARDWAGNSGEARFRFHVDSTPPRVLILGVTNGTFYRSALIPEIAAQDVLDTSPSLNCSLDGKPYSLGAKIGDGNHSLLVRTVDRAGNWAAASVDFAVDSIAPKIQIDIEEGGEYKGSVTPSINVTDEAGYTALDAYLDGNPYKVGSEIGPGTHTLQVVATDRAGNEASRELVFTVRRRQGLLLGFGIALIAAFCIVLFELWRGGRLNMSRITRRGVGL